ncbi:beta-glucosidase [Allocatelliglobosispora scoriae]|uniref:Beta-glucosidase n=1 Tax=Allocatelliglobosispora scoriae TaxID=643052 RepID=A0A841BQS8_9ACTN|nr:GH1 family beta-glucosidase [Allocatelliglobosispora scoriae]MBB5871407.1 beta-glucosidase [Allocatelliglobosispora scoriae]
MSRPQHDVGFPPGFVWGAATAAYQIEGAARDDGRGPSIWDTFCRMPGKVHRGHSGDVACDHYHRFAQDVALMRELGLHTYRFSVAWPRIQPDGTGPANPRGLDFYDRLVDELLANGIDPMVTLYHWDLPQPLEDRGGWASRETAWHFADYASIVHTRLGDRIGMWTTLNEPWCAAFLGYASGVHAPGREDPATAFAAAHHLLLAHGLATAALRSAGAATVALTLNLAPVVATDERVASGEAAYLVDGLLNRLFLEPTLAGGYPDDILAVMEKHGGLEMIRPGDREVIGEPIDLLGVNYYNPTFVYADPAAPANPAFPGSEGVGFAPAPGAVTGMEWPIEPWGLTELLERLHRDYSGTPLLITENGAAFDDTLSDGVVDDQARLSYLNGHLRAAHDAISRGVDLRGYLVWSLLDNFEWAYGYDKRFGIVHVDFATQRRTPKASALWYAKVIAENGF